MKPHRMRMTHNLLLAYGLFDKMDVLATPRATDREMTRFHSDEYINFLKMVSPETISDHLAALSRFNVLEDCPVFDGLWEYCQIAAGGSLAGAARLNRGESTIAINWAGGLHHAKKAEASGFCYINDCVLAILELLKVHARVLYVDIDIHHGDGVEEAFYTTDRVMTASFHKFGDYFPGTGDVVDVGIGRGKYYSANFPLRDGIDDESYREIFVPVMERIMEWYRPGAVVLQCGADSLSGDRLGCFNLSLVGHAQCVDFFMTYDVPLLMLGGGGYTIRNVARCWAYETSRVVGETLTDQLPFNENNEFYGPDYQLHIRPSNMENHNSRAELEQTKLKIFEHLRHLPHAPSTPFIDTPRISPLGVHRRDAAEDEDPDVRHKNGRAQTVVDFAGSDDEDDDQYISSLRHAKRKGRRLNFPRSRFPTVAVNSQVNNNTHMSNSGTPSYAPIRSRSFDVNRTLHGGQKDRSTMTHPVEKSNSGAASYAPIRSAKFDVNRMLHGGQKDGSTTTHPVENGPLEKTKIEAQDEVRESNVVENTKSGNTVDIKKEDSDNVIKVERNEEEKKGNRSVLDMGLREFQQDGGRKGINGKEEDGSISVATAEEDGHDESRPGRSMMETAFRESVTRKLSRKSEDEDSPEGIDIDGDSEHPEESKVDEGGGDGEEMRDDGAYEDSADTSEYAGVSMYRRLRMSDRSARSRMFGKIRMDVHPDGSMEQTVVTDCGRDEKIEVEESVDGGSGLEQRNTMKNAEVEKTDEEGGDCGSREKSDEGGGDGKLEGGDKMREDELEGDRAKGMTEGDAVEDVEDEGEQEDKGDDGSEDKSDGSGAKAEESLTVNVHGLGQGSRGMTLGRAMMACRAERYGAEEEMGDLEVDDSGDGENADEGVAEGDDDGSEGDEKQKDDDGNGKIDKNNDSKEDEEDKVKNVEGW